MKDDRFPPPGTGESMTTRGEELAKSHPEEGGTDLGEDESGRPAKGSTARMKSSIDPKDPVDPNSPKNPPG